MKKDILKKIIKLKKENLKLARAFIIQAKSSSPRNTGTEMLITEEGETFGSIGGGQDEKTVIEKALDLIENGKSEKLKLTLTRKEAAEIGWVCGGQIDIFIQIIS
ncbi:putative sulfurylase small subunit (molybdopterin cytosine dinucleotide biosynthesis) [Halanaerobium saccharolyticum]|uniref:Putative sulfurylase small subunit (Molybdopterin cytosine dinucleotide biosynthesis) n=1 Tax=Halanaerobium saccharolyticum TaxID=43595 RepID=A0A4R7Z981_9FIRM|nr:XdhC family protein [Halanaerobium saccharolyticum]RAK11849.1 putative sulfurylase small subunit (molybdopterin cytosine dinucleotide biosynthesis) [Halanaerobium saccharolyticum]TDW07690.1 putative sulfurylase small subunit (molybdopterin cytosine dinucleotide biosynthesis) [Halanaerobium saccharolyticum]TDX64611.1 putative sulfurylase small subunit (molybdopterin cytosine dinucleotide biosynthesis) [Halanaerobium saccharolyticum]